MNVLSKSCCQCLKTIGLSRFIVHNFSIVGPNTKVSKAKVGLWVFSAGPMFCYRSTVSRARNFVSWAT